MPSTAHKALAGQQRSGQGAHAQLPHAPCCQFQSKEGRLLSRLKHLRPYSCFRPLRWPAHLCAAPHAQQAKRRVIQEDIATALALAACLGLAAWALVPLALRAWPGVAFV